MSAVLHMMHSPQLGVQRSSLFRSQKPCIHAALASGQYTLRSALQSRTVKPGTPCRTSALSVTCRQRRDWGSRNSSSSSRNDKAFRFKFNQVDISLAEDQMWRLLIPFAAVFGLAIFIGPLVVGITLSAMAVGAAFSAGALAFTTLLLPLILLTGFGGLLSFGMMATLGAALVIPKMIFSVLSLAVVGGGLLLGWGGVNWLLSQQSSVTQGNGFGSMGDWQRQQQQQQQGGARGTTIDVEAGSDVDGSTDEGGPSEDVRRMASELREFDELLARREEQQRLRQWQKDS